MGARRPSGARDAELHQARKGRQWYSAMKLDTGTEARSGLVHSVHTTAANASDVTEAHRLVHGGKAEAWGDAGLPGSGEAPRAPGVAGALAGGDASGAQAAACSRAAQAERRKASSAGEGGAPVPLCAAALRIRQGALPMVRPALPALVRARLQCPCPSESIMGVARRRPSPAPVGSASCGPPERSSARRPNASRRRAPGKTDAWS